MTAISDDFTKKARRVLTLAEQEARRLNHSYIGTQHILMGLIQERATVEILSRLGVDTARVRAALDLFVRCGKAMPCGKIQFTPLARKVMELALDEARERNCVRCGPEHLLVGLLRESGGVAAGVLELWGINLERLRGRNRCPVCGGDLGKACICYPLTVKGRVVIVEGVGAEVCQQCGEVVDVELVPEQMRQIQRLVGAELAPARVAQVPVYDVGKSRENGPSLTNASNAN